MNVHRFIKVRPFLQRSLLISVFLTGSSCDSHDAEGKVKESSDGSPVDTSALQRSLGSESREESGENNGRSGRKLDGVLSSPDWISKFDYLEQNWDSLSARDRERFYDNLSLHLNGSTGFDFDSVWPLLTKIPLDSASGHSLRLKAVMYASHHGTVHDIYQKVSGAFGPGDIRNRMIESMFVGNSASPFELDEIESVLGGLEFENERQVAINGLISHLACGSDIKVLESFLKSVNPEIKQAAIRSAASFPVARYTDTVEEYEGRLRASLEIASVFSENQKKDFTNALIQRTHSADQASIVYDFLRSPSPDGFSVALSEENLKGLAQIMVQGKPELAIKKASGDQSDPRFLREVVSTWIKRDVNSTVSWYEENAQSLEAPQRDQVAFAFANEAVSNGDHETARAWAEKIEGETIRTEILEVIPKE